MIGLLVELLASWLLLRFVYHSSIDAIGVFVTTKRMQYFVTGFGIAAICCGICHSAPVLFGVAGWQVNKSFTFSGFLAGIYFVVKSVLFEELLFRGALLFILTEKCGWKIACSISAVAFGIYHWFSYGVLGNVFAMAMVFFTTAVWGWMLAFAFAKTRSVYLPVGLHLGWNIIHIVVFSKGPLGIQLLQHAGSGKLQGVPSLLIFLFQIFSVPVAVYYYLKYERKAA